LIRRHPASPRGKIYEPATARGDDSHRHARFQRRARALRYGTPSANAPKNESAAVSAGWKKSPARVAAPLAAFPAHLAEIASTARHSLSVLCGTQKALAHV
jgi:hypothetical protein